MFENWILQTFAHVRPFPDMSAMLSENLLQCNMKARGSNVGAGFPFPSHLPLNFFFYCFTKKYAKKIHLVKNGKYL